MKSRTQPWYRDAARKKISGVCAGFARRFEIPVWLTRVAFVFAFLTFPVAMVLAYLLAHYFLPERYY